MPIKILLINGNHRKDLKVRQIGFFLRCNIQLKMTSRSVLRTCLVVTENILKFALNLDSPPLTMCLLSR